MASPRRNVRAHTRKKPGGGTAKVTQHSRSGRPRKGVLSPARAWANWKKARRASRKKKTAVAVVLGGLAVIEIVAWLTLQGISLIALTAAMLAMAVAVVAGGLGGVKR